MMSSSMPDPAAASMPDTELFRVLVVDDEPDLRRGMALLVESLHAEVRTASSAEEALEELQRSPFELVISDIRMGGMSGVELLDSVTARWPGTEVVLITGFGTIAMAVSALHRGASHFLTKPFDNAEFVETIRAIRKNVLQRRTAERHAGEISGIVAVDPRMRAVLERIRQVASSHVPVHLSGESGTGKEVLARAIHRLSDVRDRPFLAVNCAALPDTLLESELFGYKRGAFTGAEKEHAGIFRQAEGGTVFLDELPSMSLAFQGKLLRVLQEKVIRPLGSIRDEEVSFRLVSATNRDLLDLVRQGQFREDLFYRLSVFAVEIPPLRERRQDIPPLAMHFLSILSRGMYDDALPPPEFSAAAMEALTDHAWPGNVRELENTVQRALILCSGPRIQPRHLQLRTREGDAVADDGSELYEDAKQRVLERFQRSFIQRMLEQNHGNVSHAALSCGLTRVALQKLMRKLDIDRADFSDA